MPVLFSGSFWTSCLPSLLPPHYPSRRDCIAPTQNLGSAILQILLQDSVRYQLNGNSVWALKGCWTRSQKTLFLWTSQPSMSWVIIGRVSWPFWAFVFLIFTTGNSFFLRLPQGQYCGNCMVWTVSSKESSVKDKHSMTHGEEWKCPLYCLEL